MDSAFDFIRLLNAPPDEAASLLSSIDSSRSMILNIPISVGLLWGLRWTLSHFEIHPRGFAASLSQMKKFASDASSNGRASDQNGKDEARNRTTDPKAVLEAVESVFQPSIVDDSNWQRHVGSSIVVDAWERFCGSIIQQFIYDNWYSYLTDDREFPAEVRKTLNRAFGEVCLRAKRVDLRTLLVRDSCRILREHLRLYRATCQSIGLERKVTGGGGSNWSARESALRSALRQNNVLHPGLESQAALRKYLRRLSEGVCCVTLEPRDTQRPLLRTLIREVFANCALLPICQQGTPSTVNFLVLNLIPPSPNEDAELADPHLAPSSAPLAHPAPSGGSATANYQSSVGQRANRSQLLEQEHIAQKAAAAQARKPLGSSPDLAQLDGGEGQGGEGATTESAPRVPPSSGGVQGAGGSASGGGQEDTPPKRKEKRPASRATTTNTPKKGRGFHGQVRAQVVAAEMVSEGKAVFVAYKIRVSDDAEEWTVARRFRNFELFHRRMRYVPGYSATLPPKRLLFHNLSVEFVEERRVRLHAYLQEVLSNPALNNSWELIQFLQPNSVLYDINEEKPGSGFFRRNKNGSASEATSPRSGQLPLPDPIPVTSVTSAERARSGQTAEAPSLPSSGTANAETRASSSAAPKKAAAAAGGPAPLALPKAAAAAGPSSSEGPKSSGASTAASDPSLPMPSTTKVASLASKFDQPSKLRLYPLLGPTPSAASLQVPSNTDASPAAQAAVHTRARSVGAGTLHKKTLSTTTAGRDADSPGQGTSEEKLAARLDMVGPDTWEAGSSLTEPLDGLIDEVFQLKSRDWFRRQVVAVARNALSLIAGDSLDRFIESQLRTLQQEHTLARLMMLLHSTLWPGGIWFQSLPHQVQLQNQGTLGPMAGTSGGSTSSSPSSQGRGSTGTSRAAGLGVAAVERPLGAAQDRERATRTSVDGLPGLDPLCYPSLDGAKLRDQRAKVLARMLGPGVSRSLVSLLGRTAYDEGMMDLFGMLQSPSFVSHLTLSLMEVNIATLFPELKFLVQEASAGKF